MKGGCVHPARSANEMPRHVVAFAHAHAWQVAIHVAVDVPHFVTSAESGINLKTKQKFLAKGWCVKKSSRKKRIKKHGATVTIPLRTSLNLFSQ